jgi:Holliday junction resolvase RusA-like endonuclease
MIHLTFFAQGEPKGQPRPRAFSRGGHARVYDPGTAEGWKSQIAIAAKDFIPPTPIESPVVLNVVLYFPRPQSHYRKSGELKPDAPHWCAKKPDFDNAGKVFGDVFTTLGFWRDDALIVDGRVVKKYVQGKSYAPGAMIEIREAVL